MKMKMKTGKPYTEEQIKGILALVDLQDGQQIPIIPSDNWYSNGLNRLYGVCIKDIRIETDKVVGKYRDYSMEILTFETDQGLISFDTDGDCCSETWFADFFNIQEILNSEIFSIESIDLQVGDYNVETDERTRQECDEVYGYRIKTKKGTGVFSLRNSSNGYYGGNICQCDRHIIDKSTSIIDQTNWMAD